MKTCTWLSILVSFFINFAFSQDLLDDVRQEPQENKQISDLLTESIEKIAPSRRIFIITNSTNAYGKGDFISLVRDGQLLSRALVAKLANGRAGIKITKVYALDLWKTIREGMQVQIIRGDDSYFNSKKVGEDEEEQFKIEQEDDLYNDITLTEGDLSLDENKNRIIKPDNAISVLLGRIEGRDLSGNTQRFSQFMAAWAYQLRDNVFVEAAYGQNVVNDYPNTGLDTKLTNITLKIKYTFKGPFFTAIQPYLGYQILRADSPGAGGAGVTAAEQDAELERVADLEENKLVFGVSAVKKLVPGWFARVDLGTDILSFGFGFEF